MMKNHFKWQEPNISNEILSFKFYWTIYLKCAFEQTITDAGAKYIHIFSPCFQKKIPHPVRKNTNVLIMSKLCDWSFYIKFCQVLNNWCQIYTQLPETVHCKCYTWIFKNYSINQCSWAPGFKDFFWLLNPTALRMAKTPLSFGHSECKRVKYIIRMSSDFFTECSSADIFAECSSVFSKKVEERHSHKI